MDTCVAQYNSYSTHLVRTLRFQFTHSSTYILKVDNTFDLLFFCSPFFFSIEVNYNGLLPRKFYISIFDFLFICFDMFCLCKDFSYLKCSLKQNNNSFLPK